MLLWAFILILLIITLLTAAAIIIPLALVVIPQQSRFSNQACVSSQGLCWSYVPDDAGCTRMTADGTTASIGSFIARLLNSAQGRFGIPLNQSTLVLLCSANGLSCKSENALDTF